jgi:hypothetical protein
LFFVCVGFTGLQHGRSLLAPRWPLVGAAGFNRPAASEPRANASSAEPLLSYELDRLFCSPRRAPNAGIGPQRAEAAS